MKKYILFVTGASRLGNQLFQYAFLRRLQKSDEHIIVVGFEELEEVFDKLPNFHNLNIGIKSEKGSRYKKIRYYLHLSILGIIRKLLKLLSILKINNYLILDDEKNQPIDPKKKKIFILKKGLLRNITYVEFVFATGEAFFDEKKISHLQIKKKFLDEADTFLKKAPPHAHRIFIHVRRGDYLKLNWNVPDKYFYDQIDFFNRKTQNNFFIFLSDDPDYVEEKFSYLDNKIISKNLHMGTDLAIMTKCHSGILSNSSYSWWGSYLMKERNIIVAPKNEDKHSVPIYDLPT